jgi:hypothetical protein
MNSPVSAAQGTEVRDRNTPQHHGSGVEPQGLEAQATRPVATPSFTEQQEILRALTGAPPLPEYPQDPAPPLEAITQAPVMPQGYVPESPVLEWLEPMRHPNGEATQISSGGQYEVAGRRCSDGFTFIARHGLDILGTCKTAVDARARCLLHYLEQCG